MTYIYEKETSLPAVGEEVRVKKQGKYRKAGKVRSVRKKGKGWEVVIR